MDKELARCLLILAVSLDDSIAKMFSIVEQIADEEMRKKFNKSVGDVMGYIARDIIFPIEAIFPELTKDK
jgi:hypothetical protein